MPYVCMIALEGVGFCFLKMKTWVHSTTKRSDQYQMIKKGPTMMTLIKTRSESWSKPITVEGDDILTVT